jgi:hypothetical protein
VGHDPPARQWLAGSILDPFVHRDREKPRRLVENGGETRRHAFERLEQVVLEDDLAISASVRSGYPLISADELTLCENGVPQPSVVCRPSMSLAAGRALKFRCLG